MLTRARHPAFCNTGALWHILQLQPSNGADLGSTTCPSFQSLRTFFGRGSAETPPEAPRPVPETSSVLPDPPSLEPDPQMLTDVVQIANSAAIEAAKGDCWFGTRAFIDLLDLTHSSLGLPWWAAIAGTNTVIRLASVPLHFWTRKNAALMTDVNRELNVLKDIRMSLTNASSLAEYERAEQACRMKEKAIQEKYGKEMRSAALSPLFSIANVVVLISQFNAISALAKEKVPSMTYEGLYWFTDLTSPDPIYALPVLCSVITLLQLYMSARGGALEEMGPQMRRPAMIFMGAMALVFIPVGHYLPSGVGILWVTNTFIGACQTILFNNKRFQKWVGLPDVPTVLPDWLKDKIQEAEAQHKPPSPQPAPAPALRPIPTVPRRDPGKNGKHSQSKNRNR